jgi:thiamine pyrophosphokinase
MSSKTAILTLNGGLQDLGVLHLLAEKNYYHLCTDGAYDILKKEDITPHAVIGDMDSIKHKPENCLLISTPDQERNDFEKALEWLIQEGYSTVHIHGFRGGRLDHELVNFSLLYHYSTRLDIFLYDGLQLARILRDGEYLFRGKKGDIISLIPLSPIENARLKGTKYPLESVNLMPGSRGLSNRFVEPEVSLRFSRGLMVVVIPYEYNI